MAGIYFGERGGGGVLREFRIHLIPVEGIQVAPMFDTMNGGQYVTGLDYLSIEPGEVEEYVLYLKSVPGYIYDYRLGLQVKFNGSHFVVWDNNDFHHGVPVSEILLSSGGGFRPGVHPDVSRWVEDYQGAWEYTLIQVAEDVEAYRRSRVFSLRTVDLDGPVTPADLPEGI